MLDKENRSDNEYEAMSEDSLRNPEKSRVIDLTKN
jgi:hypothetical protein